MRRTLLLLLLAASVLSARGGGGCFLAGTQIQAPGGSVSVENVSLGQLVLGFYDGEVVEDVVTGVVAVQRDHYLRIDTNDSEVNVTDEHPFYIGLGRFREASDLSVGDTVYLLRDGSLAPQAIQRIERVNASVTAYNLRVDGTHTFFANGFAVHNKGGCFPGDTEISCPGGNRNISSILPGDTVYSFYHGSVVETTVSDVYSLEAYEYYDIKAGAGEVNVTAEHPFYTDSGFVMAQDLHVGDRVYMDEDGTLVLENVTGKTLVQQPLEVYNLHVSGPHTFFANDFAVHNKGGCFLPGTKVQTEDGTIDIEDLKPGQTVLSFQDGGVLPAPVVDMYEVERDYYYEISAGPDTVNVTAEHPFYVGGGDYAEAQDLKPGDTVYALRNGSLSPVLVTSVSRINQSTVAYNLQVGGSHTFFANGFAVHNKGGGGGSHSSGPPPNTFYYDCSGNFNDSGTVKQCCRQASSVYLSSGATIKNGQYQFCSCTTSSGNSITAVSAFNSSLRSCTCTNSAQSLADFAVIARCPPTLLDTVCACLPVLLLAGVFIYGIATKFKTPGVGFKANSEWSSTVSVPKGKVMDKAKKVSALLSMWGRVDPAWKEEAMKSTASGTFLKLQQCWEARDYTEMTDLMEPDLYSQHVAQLEAMKARHEINRLAGLKLLDLQLVQVNNFHDPQKDTFTAWVDATAQDVIVDDRTNARIRGDDGMGVFEEFWTFQRDGESWKLKQIDQPEEGMDVITKENFDSLSTAQGVERMYEKAGGPKIKDLGVSATREREEGAVEAGMGTIKQKAGKVHRLLNFLADQDKIWDEAKMVSFTRSLFITLNVAMETRSLDNVKDNITPELAERYSQIIADMAQKGQRMEKRNLAVRDVDIVLVKNYYDNRKDEFTAWVSGQAQSVIVDEKTGGIVAGDDHVADFEEYWTFRRDGDQWKLEDVEKGYTAKSYIDEENVDEGSDKTLMDFYYSRDRAV